MNIALIGYGKMGQAIEEQALERGHKIVKIYDCQGDKFSNVQTLENVDVCIEFTQPDAAYLNCKHCIQDLGLPIVSGTTGWNKELDVLKKEVQKLDASFFYTSNFSIGVNVLFAVNRYLSKIMKDYSQYSPKIEETHHIHKKDAPSGTAVTLAEDIIKETGAWEGFTLKNEDNCIPITSFREGEVSGIHSVFWNSEIDEIELKHKAFSRKGFALGAVLAAEYIIDKKGVYSMKDLLGLA